MRRRRRGYYGRGRKRYGRRGRIKRYRTHRGGISF